MTMPDTDADFLETFLAPIRKCVGYRPAFGQGTATGLDLGGFQELYGGDPFYHWLGLDEPIVYAAHKAAGGLTSVYRQIGVGSERLFRAVLGHSLGLSQDAMAWRYEYDKPDGAQGRHTLDARIRSADLQRDVRRRFDDWLRTALNAVAVGAQQSINADGVVFEVRQGYKSADSKRQNADLRYGVRAYQANLLPSFAILSSQVSESVMRRYRNDGMLILTGVLDEDPLRSTFAFFQKVIGYDLRAFFERSSPTIKAGINQVVVKLLSP